MSKLEPVDKKRCQVEVVSYRPFVMGGSVYQSVRCEKKALWIASQKNPKGAMSMCGGCKKEFDKQIHKHAPTTFKRITP